MKKRLINKYELKIYDLWNKERYVNREDKDNIFPIGLSDIEFLAWIRNIFLGSDWYCVNPISHDQINEVILKEILFKITGKTSKERC